MLSSLLFGGSYGLAAGLQPGPLQAFLLARVAANGWRHTLLACVAPLISDGPIAAVAILLLGQLSIRAQHSLRAAGGCLLIYLAWVTFRQWRHGEEACPPGSAPRTLLEAVLVNLLNPNPYLGWTLVLGPSVHAAYQTHPANAVALVAAFYVALVATLAAFIVAAGTMSRFADHQQTRLVGLSAGLLGILGSYLLASAVWRLATLA